MTCCCGAIAPGVIQQARTNGVLTAGDITSLVENAGGNVNALFRASLAWDSWSDVDFHIHEPTGGHIYYSSKTSSSTGGRLDVDMNVGSKVQSSNSAKKSKPAVENIMYTDLDRMADGEYKISFVQYGANNSRAEGADRPYLLLTHRTPEEERMSHYVLIKQNGTNLPENSGHNEPIATVRKTGTAFQLVALAENTVILKNHNFDIGAFSVAGELSTNDTANAAASGTNPIGA